MGDAGQDHFAVVDQMLHELMIKHLEMAQLCDEYREIVERARERSWDHEGRRLARALPGARYHVSSTFAREQALKIEAELKQLFPAEE